MSSWDAYESITIFLGTMILAVVHRRVMFGIEAPILELAGLFAAWMIGGAVVAWIIEGGFD